MSEQADWLRAMALMGISAGTQIQIAVDSSGKLYAVLQGDYEGTLTTVKLDSAGRISAFVIDSSDAWGQILEVGNAELAARLGSAVNYDRRGQVVSVTDFSQGYGIWQTFNTGDDSTTELDPTTYRAGGYSVKCTGIDGVASDSKLLARLPVVPVATVGLSVFFSIPVTARTIYLVIQYDDAVTRIQGQCRYDVADEVLDIYDGVTGWEEIEDNVTFRPDKRSFNYFKLVIDGDNDAFLRLLFNDIEKDLSSYATQGLATLGYAHLYLGIWAYMRSGEADVIYLDVPVVTINEPT